MSRVIVTLALGLALVGCGSGLGFDSTPTLIDSTFGTAPAPVVPAGSPGAPAAAPPSPADGPAAAIVDHPYFPLEPGTVRIYEGFDDGIHRRDEVRVLAAPAIIDGTSCAATFQEVYLGGELAEVTTEWFAQDADGNIWKFGEESFEVDGPLLVLKRDSWTAGVGGARPWVMLAASPRVGDVYVELRPDGDVLHVLSVTALATVPAGVFADCLEIEENPDDEDDSDLIIYGPGAGMVSEQSPSGRIELISVGQG